MQKIYVLLRGDQQTGPYSLEEMSQFDLKPYDLIWIEGKSAGWYYPQEIGALHPYLSFLPKQPNIQPPAQENVFVSTPSSTIQQTTQEYLQAEHSPVVKPEESYKSSTPASANIEEQVYAQFRKAPEEKAAMDNRTAPQANPKTKPVVSTGVAIVSILVVGGIFAASWIMNRNPNDRDNASMGIATNDPLETEEITTAVDENDDTETKQTTSVFKQKQSNSRSVAKPRPVIVTNRKPSNREQPIFSDTPADESGTNESTTLPAEEEQQVSKEESAEKSRETAAPQEKKKKLRDKIFDIFKKKPEEANPVEEDGSERSSSRRETNANLAQMVHVRFTVPNDWMMGIKGAKATLVNRSSETITRATVEVLYYDEDDQLLQKKVISFGKINGKGSQTIFIPDHSSATKVDYKVVTVTGTDGPAA